MLAGPLPPLSPAWNGGTWVWLASKSVLEAFCRVCRGHSKCEPESIRLVDLSLSGLCGSPDLGSSTKICPPSKPQLTPTTEAISVFVVFLGLWSLGSAHPLSFPPSTGSVPRAEAQGGVSQRRKPWCCITSANLLLEPVLGLGEKQVTPRWIVALSQLQVSQFGRPVLLVELASVAK